MILMQGLFLLSGHLQVLNEEKKEERKRIHYQHNEVTAAIKLK